MRKISTGLVIAVCLSRLSLASFDAATPPAAKAGYLVLDQYIKSFQEMAMHGASAKDVLEPYLQKMAADTKTAKEKGEIDLVFYTRFSRILAITTLFVKPDPGNILKPVIDREAGAFIKDVTGEDPIMDGGAMAVGQVANALAEEIINLQIYLDTLDRRVSLRQKLVGSVAGPKK